MDSMFRAKIYTGGKRYLEKDRRVGSKDNLNLKNNIIDHVGVL